MHLAIYFCGTKDTGGAFLGAYDYVNPKHVKTIFVQGCDRPQVCNSSIFPDLKSFANRFCYTLFQVRSDKPQLEISPEENEVLESIGIRLDVDCASALVDMKGKPIESITLCGYSRGAVTCFEVARVLNKIAPHIPVDIVANQPVPGNCYQGPGTNAKSIADCSDLTNIKNVSVILGAYTGAAATEFDLYIKREIPKEWDLKRYKNSYIFVAEQKCLLYVDQNGTAEVVKYNRHGLADTLDNFHIDVEVEKKHTLSAEALVWFKGHYKPEAIRENTSFIHRGFYSQILPKLPKKANQEHIIIPCEHHTKAHFNSPMGMEHLHMKMADFLHRKNGVSKQGKKIKLVSGGMVQRKTEEASDTYSHAKKVAVAPFPPVNQLQSFFGLKKQDAYRYIDKLHPTPRLRKGMILQEGQTLIDLWQAQDKHASHFSTQLTKDLVAKIKKTHIHHTQELTELLVQTDKWLIAKENSSTSRYYQVEGLRNYIYDHLINKHSVAKEKLDELNRSVLRETGYFLKHWVEGSAAASWFKTDATRQLDKAFAEHAKVSPYNKEADEALLSALNQWQLNKNSQSRRYDLVVEMYEHLKEVIDNTYGIKKLFSPSRR